MLTGRKLLLADDSAAIRKVIELTFSDEGMEVTSVADGRAALERLEQINPDVVLADVFMPEIGGFEVCRLIKQNERFARTPVMLLVSSFDPFDETEARKVGADDIVAKPFQSIRQLVSRVASLLHDSDAAKKEPFQDYGTPELPQPESAEVEQPSEEPVVTVLVEAPKLETVEAAGPSGPSCAADVELQTADTRRFDEPLEERQLSDTIEMEPVPAPSEAAVAEPQMNVESIEPAYEPVAEIASPQLVRVMDEPLLELAEETDGQQLASDDLVLDLDFEASETVQALHEAVIEPAVATAPPLAAPIAAPSPAVAPSLSETHPEADLVGTAVSAEPETLAATQPELGNLSPAAIDAIAQRVVERMSDKVVRDIAWEVVPELAELLIKQKLNENT